MFLIGSLIIILNEQVIIFRDGLLAVHSFIKYLLAAC